MKKEEKKAFFDELWKLDVDSEGDEDQNELEKMVKKCKRPPGQERMKASRILTTAQPTLCSLSSRAHTSPRRPLSQSCSKEPRSKSTRRRSVYGASKMIDPLDKKALRLERKRKRMEKLDILPESQKIFKNLKFYFIPNNDFSVARQIRIRRCRERGAQWARQWQEGITHVIMDPTLTYAELLAHSKGAFLREEMVVVNETYVSDCITYRFLVNPSQPLYHVSGRRENSEECCTSRQQMIVNPLRVTGGQDFASSPKSSNEILSPFDSDARSGISPHIARIHGSNTTYIEHSTDLLTLIIEQTKSLGHLPIDLDESNEEAYDATPENSENPDSDQGDRERERIRSTVSKSRFANFCCMSKHDGSSNEQNPNSRTIVVLQEMHDYYEQTKVPWKPAAYRRAINALKRQTRKITSANEAFTIPGIGQRLADKIEEISSTDKLRRLEDAKNEPNGEILRVLNGIYGVGLAQAEKWVRQGYRSLDDLRNSAQLTETQNIGIVRYEDFQTRIPRAEMDSHDLYVREAIRQIDPAVQVIIAGSYRRGAKDSGDIDFMVTKPNCGVEILTTIIVERIVPRLLQKGYLRAALSIPNKKFGSKWHGAATLPGQSVWRRIDFLFVPWEELGAALIYFTGNQAFNRSIRLLASKKGMRLNERGLWRDVMRGKNGERLTQGSLVESKDEKKIFELLDVPWRPPEHRNC